MTFEKILNDLTFNNISAKDAYDEISKKDKMKVINYYLHIKDITKEPLKDGQLQELNAIVGIVQILYNSSIGSPINDNDYDTLQEMLVNMGIPRLTGSIEINDHNKVQHKYTNLRGTLSKVYYLESSERRTNKSRKYLDEWIKKAEAKYLQSTGNKIDLNGVKVMLTPKFDGVSAIREVSDKKSLWITRGDTSNNQASDVSHILNIFNDVFPEEPGTGIKYEIMMTEENKDRINELYRQRQYKNSRQIVTATLNSNEADFKADYLYPVPLRIMHSGDVVEQIHPDLIKNFPTEICTLKDRSTIRDFANYVRYVNNDRMKFRTDGVVITILDPKIQRALGRDNDINNFEVAYKFTEEYAYSRVKDIEFYMSAFGFITPVLVVNDVILKGNTINRISLSNKERFDELNFSYGDEVKVLYDIIPYATVDDRCRRVPNGRKIEFIRKCPSCHEELLLNVIQVMCDNPKCPSRIIGRILNYCNNLRIQNIGYSTLDTLHAAGLLKHGIRSLYKLKKKKYEIEELEGFGKLKTNRIVAEIESKRKINDYEFFGSLGIGGFSIKTFKVLFSQIKLSDFLDMIRLKNFDLLTARLLSVNGISDIKAEILVKYLRDRDNVKEIENLLKEVKLFPTFGYTDSLKGRIVFTGCRPSENLLTFLKDHGWDPSDTWSNKSKYLIVPNDSFESSKVRKANELGIPIISLNDKDPLEVLVKNIPNLK